MASWSALFSRPGQAPVYTRPSLTLFFLLAGSFLLTLVPHVVQFPIWLTIGIIVAMAARSIIEYYRLPLPSTTFCGIMAVILLGFILVQFDGNVLGRDPGTAFTAGLLAIKFYELRRPRDVALIIFSCFFVVMSALLYSQVLELFVYCLIMMWILTALLLRVHTGDLPQDNLLRMLGQSGLIFLQALPLAGVLFFFLPRVQGPLGLPFSEGTLGLSDSVAPGSIARLADNDTPALYVLFPAGSNVPLANTMYWRALVLWNYEHGVWVAGEEGNLAAPPGQMLARSGNELGPGEIQQTIVVLAHNQKWLFALDQPVSLPLNSSESGGPNWARGTAWHTVELNANPGPPRLDHMARYDVISSEKRPEENLSAMKEKAIAINNDPKDPIDPAVVALADDLHKGLGDDQELDYISAVIHYFRHNGFVYSMTPGDQGTDWLTNFLFKSKIGFCEHYASAFAVLMRLEHVPTRVVVGYLGADYNPYTYWYTVSQSNAHAWDEVFIYDKADPKETRGRWERIDPTALITAVEETSLTSNTGPNGDNLRVIPRAPTFAEKYLPAWVREELKELSLRREEVETSWDNLVLSYDSTTQDRLAQALGFGEGARFNLLLGCLAAAAICIIVFQRWMGRRPAIPPVEILYSTFCRTMARRGIPRAKWEGPLAYTERVAEAFPDDRQAIERVGSIVATIRYGPSPVDPAAPHQLKSILAVLSASQAATISREKK